MFINEPQCCICKKYIKEYITSTDITCDNDCIYFKSCCGRDIIYRDSMIGEPPICMFGRSLDDALREYYEKSDKILKDFHNNWNKEIREKKNNKYYVFPKCCDKPTFSQHMDAVCTGVGNVDALKDILPPEQIAEMLKKNDGGDA